jgi:ubiquinol-cytochrome c reductase iron-sulfur subunit
MEEARSKQIDQDKREFLRTSTLLLSSIGLAISAVPFITSWLPRKSVISSLTIDVSMLSPGQLLQVVWQGKPLLVLHRTQSMLDDLVGMRGKLRDPDSRVEQQPSYARNVYRSLNPQYLILIGVCTHLGCCPQYKPPSIRENDPGGFHCPCHSSVFDLSGRVMKAMPAPINLEVPPHHFINNQKILIGEDPQA